MLEAGKLLQNRYRIEKQIGQGGMGAVYFAKDERFKSVVAIKEMLFTEENFRKAFDREARLLNSLRHPALPNVSDYFAEGDKEFLVMEYIAGEDLYETLIRTGKPFPLEDVLKWANQLLDALNYLHNQTIPVIHRDIKPQNLKLAPDKQIILLDFGLAKGNPAEITNTATKSIFGYSLGYASLEQIQGTGTEPRSDLYSLGATLYHLMTGIPPTDALTRAMTVLNAKPDPLEPAHLANENIPPAISEILRRAMSLNADQRPNSATEMRELFENQESLTFENTENSPIKIIASDDIHSRQTVIIPGTNPAPRQADLKTKVFQSAESDKDLSKITKLASAHKTDGNFKNKYALAATVFGILLVFGAGIYGLYNYQNANQQETLIPAKTDGKIQVSVNEKTQTDSNSVTNENSSINLDQTENEPEIIAENLVRTETKKQSLPANNSAKTTVVKKNDENDEDDDEINLENVKISEGRVETDQIIIENGNVTFKKNAGNNIPKPPKSPSLTPEQLRKLTPEQRRQLRKAEGLQKQTEQKPPTPPTPEN